MAVQELNNMNNKFKNMSDDKLKRWLTVYEDFPATRVLLTKNEYKKGILEAYGRFKSDEYFRYYYFTQVNKTGVLNDYKKWLEELK